MSDRYDPRYDPRAPEEEKPRPFSDLPPPPPDIAPQGDAYDWYTRGLELLENGDAAAAVQVLGHTVTSEPESRMAREALARAQFDMGMYEEARDELRVDHLDQPGGRLRPVRARPGRDQAR